MVLYLLRVDNIDELASKLNEAPSMEGLDLAKIVSTKKSISGLKKESIRLPQLILV